MADTNDILKAIESIKSDVGSIKNDLQDVKQAQAQTNTRVEIVASEQSKIITAVEAVKAGQDDLIEKVANLPTRPEFQDFRASVGRKVQDHESRIEELEKDADIPHPHRH